MSALRKPLVAALAMEALVLNRLQRRKTAPPNPGDAGFGRGCREAVGSVAVLLIYRSDAPSEKALGQVATAFPSYANEIAVVVDVDDQGPGR
jgi:hypothetical protein